MVAVEQYTQQVTIQGRVLRPRTLLAEYAIVKAGDTVGWTGFRDVVQVDGREVADRRGRLETLFAGPAGGEGELKRIADESARQLPARMTELYDGPITSGTRAPMTGRAVGRATYSDYKRFETAVKLVIK